MDEKGKAEQTELVSKELLCDNEILKLGISESDVSMYRMQKFKESFTLDKWIHIPQLKKLTFDTLFIKVSTNEAKSFLSYCRYVQLKISNKKHIEINHLIIAKQYLHNKQQIDQDIQHLKDKIDAKIKSSGWKNNGFFAKFNSRSPKDAFGYDGQNEVVIKAFYTELDAIKNKNNKQQITVNDALIAWYQSTAKLLKIKDGNDVIEMFSRSFRSLEDLQGTLRLGEQYMDISIALRKWNDDVPLTPFGEFRCFVHNKKLNAITQYLSNMYFPILHEKKNMIMHKICKFYDENVKDYVPMDSFVVDFLMLSIDDDNNRENKIYVIEFNPFYKWAGAGLFSWKEDRELFLNGPTQIRVRDDVDPLGLEYMHSSWVKSFQQYQTQNNQNGSDDTLCVVV